MQTDESKTLITEELDFETQESKKKTSHKYEEIRSESYNYL